MTQYTTSEGTLLGYIFVQTLYFLWPLVVERFQPSQSLLIPKHQEASSVLKAPLILTCCDLGVYVYLNISTCNPLHSSPVGLHASNMLPAWRDFIILFNELLNKVMTIMMKICREWIWLYMHTHRAFQRKMKRKVTGAVSADLILWELVGLQRFIKSLFWLTFSQSDENCCWGKCSTV